MEIVFIVLAAIAVIAFFTAVSGRSDSPTYPGASPSNTSSRSDYDDEYLEEFDDSPTGSYTFIQINQFISINGSYPVLVSQNESIPRFVTTSEGFRAVGMQHRYQNFKRILLSNRLTPGNEYKAVVTLQIEPGNSYDPNAVLVIFQGLPLAYIPREFSHLFHAALAPVGGAAICLSKLWFDGQYRRGGKHNSITLLTSPYPKLES